MPTIKSKVGGGTKVDWGATHRSGSGELISVQRMRGRWFLYFFGNWDTKRVRYCEKHRRNYVPANFREGEFSISTIVFTLRLIKSGEWDGL